MQLTVHFSSSEALPLAASTHHLEPSHATSAGSSGDSSSCGGGSGGGSGGIGYTAEVQGNAVVGWSRLLRRVGLQQSILGINGDDSQAMLLFGPYISALNAKPAGLQPGGQSSKIDVPVIYAATGQYLPHRLTQVPAIKATVATNHYKLAGLKVQDRMQCHCGGGPLLQRCYHTVWCFV